MALIYVTLLRQPDRTPRSTCDIMTSQICARPVKMFENKHAKHKNIEKKWVFSHFEWYSSQNTKLSYFLKETINQML